MPALLREWQARKDDYPLPWQTLYIGGGTPSALDDSELEALVKGLELPAPPEEFTMEVNPEDVSPERARNWRRMGVNRISMGVQSFVDEELRAVGRRHDANKAHEAVECLHAAGFSNISLDLIYGLPYQTQESWRYSIGEMLNLRPEHFSAYCLSVEENSPLRRIIEKGKLVLPDEDFAAECYDTLCAEAAGQGYEHYEISNFSLPGCRSKHNSSYWDYIPYLGLGPSAHSFDGFRRSYNPDDIERYQSGETSPQPEESTLSNRLNDLVFISLRRKEGLSRSSLKSLMPEADIMFEKNASALVGKGLMLYDSESEAWLIPEKEWMRADWIIRELMFD